MITKRNTILIFVIFSFLFYIDKIIFGPFSIIRIQDTFDSEFSKCFNTGKLFFEYGFFAWYPNYPGGIPAYASHVPPFHLSCLLLMIFPAWVLYNSLVIIFMIFAGYGMYRFLCEYMKLSYWISLAGGIFFSLSTQIQLEPEIYIVFSHVFPLFFVWFIDIVQSNNLQRKIIFPIIGLNFVFLISYPVLSLPHFFILQILLIILVKYSHKEITKKLLKWSVIIWTGYILIFIPSLYSLWEFIPFVSRTYSLYPINFSSFTNFIKVTIYDIFILISARSMVFVLIIAGFSLIPYSKKVKRVFLIMIILLILSGFLDSTLSGVLANTIFEKMDLRHFYWTLPFIFIVFVFTTLDELFSNGKLAARYFFSSIIGLVFLFLLLYPLKKLSISIFLLNFIPFLITCCVYNYKYKYARFISLIN